MNFDSNMIFPVWFQNTPMDYRPVGFVPTSPLRHLSFSLAPNKNSFGRVATSFHEVKARFASTSRFLADGSPAKVLEVSLASREVGIAQRKPFRV